MIQSIRFENFKVFEELDVKLAPLTGIVGPNASGKTSILEGIYFNSACATQPLSRGGTKTVPELDKRKQIGKSDMCLVVHDGNARYSYTLAANKQGRFTNDTSHPIATCTTLLRLDPNLLRKASASLEVTPSSKSNGEGFPSALAFMALNQPDLFHGIQTRLKEVIPSVRRIRFAKLEITRLEPEVVIGVDNREQTRHVRRKRLGESLLFDMVGAESVPAEQTSEGTLLVLAILYFLTTSVRPALILLDDLDHGLHPKAQRDLIRMIRRLMELEPETQVIFTTHSPYLLDSLEPHEVLLTTLRDDGTAACRSLTEHPDFEQWKDEMRPGEMWSMFGEDWVANLERNRGK